MARQVGPLLLTGTLGGITFYNTEGIHYARAKRRGISKHKFKNSPSMEATRRNAGIFAEAQKISQELYRALPSNKRSQKKVWYPLRNRAQELLREGKQSSEVREILQKQVLPTLLHKAFKEKRRTSKERQRVQKEEGSLDLGRYTKAVDNLSLLSELSAANILVGKLLKEKKEEQGLLYSHREDKSFGKRKRLR